MMGLRTHPRLRDDMEIKDILNSNGKPRCFPGIYLHPSVFRIGTRVEDQVRGIAAGEIDPSATWNETMCSSANTAPNPGASLRLPQPIIRKALLVPYLSTPLSDMLHGRPSCMVSIQYQPYRVTLVDMEDEAVGGGHGSDNDKAAAAAPQGKTADRDGLMVRHVCRSCEEVRFLQRRLRRDSDGDAARAAPREPADDAALHNMPHLLANMFTATTTDASQQSLGSGHDFRDVAAKSLSPAAVVETLCDSSSPLYQAQLACYAENRAKASRALHHFVVHEQLQPLKGMFALLGGSACDSSLIPGLEVAIASMSLGEEAAFVIDLPMAHQSLIHLRKNMYEHRGHPQRNVELRSGDCPQGEHKLDGALLFVVKVIRCALSVSAMPPSPLIRKFTSSITQPRVAGAEAPATQSAEQPSHARGDERGAGPGALSLPYNNNPYHFLKGCRSLFAVQAARSSPSHSNGFSSSTQLLTVPPLSWAQEAIALFLCVALGSSRYLQPAILSTNTILARPIYTSPQATQRYEPSGHATGVATPSHSSKSGLALAASRCSLDEESMLEGARRFPSLTTPAGVVATLASGVHTGEYSPARQAIAEPIPFAAGSIASTVIEHNHQRALRGENTGRRDVDMLWTSIRSMPSTVEPATPWRSVGMKPSSMEALHFLRSRYFSVPREGAIVTLTVNTHCPLTGKFQPYEKVEDAVVGSLTLPYWMDSVLQVMQVGEMATITVADADDDASCLSSQLGYLAKIAHADLCAATVASKATAQELRSAFPHILTPTSTAVASPIGARGFAAEAHGKDTVSHLRPRGERGEPWPSVPVTAAADPQRALLYPVDESVAYLARLEGSCAAGEAQPQSQLMSQRCGEKSFRITLERMENRYDASSFYFSNPSAALEEVKRLLDLSETLRSIRVAPGKQGGGSSSGGTAGVSRGMSSKSSFSRLRPKTAGGRGFVVVEEECGVGTERFFAPCVASPQRGVVKAINKLCFALFLLTFNVSDDDDDGGLEHAACDASCAPLPAQKILSHTAPIQLEYERRKLIGKLLDQLSTMLTRIKGQAPLVVASTSAAMLYCPEVHYLPFRRAQSRKECGSDAEVLSDLQLAETLARAALQKLGKPSQRDADGIGTSASAIASGEVGAAAEATKIKMHIEEIQLQRQLVEESLLRKEITDL